MHNEKVFTPDRMVSLMLDEIGYYGEDILCKHIMDNSCGDGAFLVQAVQRYIFAYKSKHGNCKGLCDELKTYIHGIEIDSKCWKRCFENCQNIVKEYCDDEDIDYVDFDIINADSTDLNIISMYMFKMDYIVGNPPYCNVHDFGENYDRYKKFSFAKDGMADLYLIFFEISILMCNNNTGKIIYITPSSWCTSLAGKQFRWYLKYTGLLSEIVELGHNQIFDGVTTYSMITLLEYGYHEKCRLKAFDDKRYVFSGKKDKNFYDCFIDGKFYPCSDDVFKDIMTYDKTKYVTVNNGLATLNDKLFISDDITDCENVIRAYKASKQLYKHIIYPYDIDGRPLSWEDLGNKTKKYLSDKMEELGKEKKNNWYQYGRTQGLIDINKNKVAINNIIRNNKDIKIKYIPKGECVYSGFYVKYNSDEYDKKFYIENIVTSIVYSPEFDTYVQTLGKYKRDGYYTFNTKDLEQYLNYKIHKLGLLL